MSGFGAKFGAGQAKAGPVQLGGGNSGGSKALTKAGPKAELYDIVEKDNEGSDTVPPVTPPPSPDKGLAQSRLARPQVSNRSLLAKLLASDTSFTDKPWFRERMKRLTGMYCGAADEQDRQLVPLPPAITFPRYCSLPFIWRPNHPYAAAPPLRAPAVQPCGTAPPGQPAVEQASNPAPPAPANAQGQVELETGAGKTKGSVYCWATHVGKKDVQFWACDSSKLDKKHQVALGEQGEQDKRVSDAFKKEAAKSDHPTLEYFWEAVAVSAKKGGRSLTARNCKDLWIKMNPTWHRESIWVDALSKELMLHQKHSWQVRIHLRCLARLLVRQQLTSARRRS